MPLYPFSRQIASLFLLSLAASGAVAQTVSSTIPTNDNIQQWGLGIGVRAKRSPYRDFGTDSKAIPLLFYNSNRFRIFGTAADLKLYSNKDVEFALRAKYVGDGYKSSDAAILRGMDERKDGVWIGAVGTWAMPAAKLSLEWLSDASGNSDGQSLKLGIERSFKVGSSSTITPHAQAAWMNNKYVNYYYGVKASEVNASRTAYSPDGTTNVSLGVRFDYSLTKNQLLMMDLDIIRYGNQIKDSPLVDRSSSPSLMLGYLYRF